MCMQVIHAETEQANENAVVNLIVDRMLNHIRELELNTTDVVGNEKANEMMNARPELDTNSAEAAAYFNNFEIVSENMDLGKNTTGFSASGFSLCTEIQTSVSAAAMGCIICFRCRGIIICIIIC